MELAVYINLSTFLGLKNQIVNFLNFSSSRAVLSSKLVSYSKTMLYIIHAFLEKSGCKKALTDF